MKRLLLTITIVFFLGSCDDSVYSRNQNPGITTVKNTSTNFDVTYEIKNMPAPAVIAKGDQAIHNLPRFSNMQNYSPDKRVILKTEYPYENDVVFTFSDRDSFTVRVNNATSENVTLSADGWMDNMSNILPGNANDANHTGIVYTDNPVFTVTTSSGFPAEVVYNLDNGTFMTTVRWGQ